MGEGADDAVDAAKPQERQNSRRVVSATACAQRSWHWHGHALVRGRGEVEEGPCYQGPLSARGERLIMFRVFGFQLIYLLNFYTRQMTSEFYEKFCGGT